MSSTVEHNASGARVRIRPAWVIMFMMFFAGSFYRLYWAWRTNDDLATFCNERDQRASAYEPLKVNASIPPTLLGISFIGWILLFVYVFPWGVSAFPGEHHETLTARIIGGSIGVALLIPGMFAIIKIRSRIRHARRMAGLPEDTVWTARVFYIFVVCELVTVPIWLFALQHSLNDLWGHYPALLDEDLHGEFSPPALRDAAIRRRPALHQERLERIAGEIGDPFRVPWVTMVFALVCVGMWIFQVSYHGFFPDEKDLETIGGLRANIDGEWWKFWVANILHGSVEHIVGNLTAWAIIATMLERAVGALRMIGMIIVGAAGCSIGALIATPNEVGVGASGVVFAAVGMAAFVDPMARRPLGKMGWLMAVIGLGFSTFVPGISSGGHVGGLLGGLIMGAVVLFVWKVPRNVVIRHRLTPVLDRTAPLAPNRELSVSERALHLAAQRDAGAISPAQYERLRSALVQVG